MFHIKQIIRNAITATAAIVTVGCGGSGSYWDSFQPRPATVEDLRNNSFSFDWFPEGNTIHSELVEFRIEFGEISAGGEGVFTIIESDGGTATGAITLDAPDISFQIDSTTGDIPLETGDIIQNEVEADATDGRIRLYNSDRTQEMTSLPK